MFLGKYELDGTTYNYIYFKTYEGFKLWNEETFSPTCEGIELLDMSIKGKTYDEKKENARNLAINWQLNFAGLSWSYGELATIYEYFERIGKRYGLLKEFKENAIC